MAISILLVYIYLYWYNLTKKDNVSHIMPNLGYFCLLHSIYNIHGLIDRLVAIFTHMEPETPIRRHEAATYDLCVLLDDL